MIKFLTEPLLFDTEKGNYCYDNSTRIVIPVNKSEKNFLSAIKIGDTIHEEDFQKNNLNELLHKIVKYNLFQSDFQLPKITEQFIKEKLLTEGISHLCLIVTDACNFRCKYCIYSDHYFYSKNFSNKCMDFQTAKSAIDYYMNVNIKSIQYNPNLSISIGFYGGEPLINWKLIKQVVEYTNDNYKKVFDNIFFSITTNAYLLTEDKINYMFDKNFSISVSLDGDKENHDRNRVTINEKGTFDRVFKNLALMDDIYREKVRLNKPVLPYGILITYDNLTDFSKLDKYFMEHPELDKRIQRVNRVSNINTEYYKGVQLEQSYLERRKDFIKGLIERAKDKQFEKKATNFSKTILKSIIFDPMMNTAYSNNELRGTCLPGIHKLAVDSDGNFHMCEKINPHYPVGNIETGLDPTKQANYMNNFFSALAGCKNCNLNNICNLCYVITETDGQGFQLKDTFCKNFREGIINSFSTYYSILENNPGIFQEIRE
ncbi:MAG: hypothetical protein C6W54_03380 [Bacillaceae bacterium]|uniref:radical SAM protein n=1 Tax=Aeribacillus composti TaxID=1868734 RepID=UPI000E3A27E3|nr:radical SAM protein [Aeribacillus pallidus]REJ25712.1 MAG: hypothetical protein C6W54_03380 [Bacillaceae bacterium]